MMKIALCILTRNESECLKKALPEMVSYFDGEGQDLFDRIAVLDGHSTDGTVEMFQEKNIEVIEQTGKGRGAAFHTAFNQITADAWVFYSPDGNEDIKDLPKFVEELKKGAEYTSLFSPYSA